MNRRKTWSLIILVSLLILGFTAVQAAPHQTIDWYVIAGGGGSDSAGTLSLDSTLGQAFVGEDQAGLSTGSVGLCAGFWCGALPQRRLHLPFVVRRGP